MSKTDSSTFRQIERQNDTMEKKQLTEKTPLISDKHSDWNAWKSWRKEQVIPAVVLVCSCFIGMMSVKMVGPSLLELQLRTSTTIEQISWVVSVRALGAMLGALVLGYVIEHKSRWLQVSSMIFISGAIFVSLPWIKNFWGELFMFLLYGFTTGYAFPGGQLTIYSLWDNVKDCVSWQNLFQLAYTLGGLFGPLLVQPFLLEVQDIQDNNSTTNMPVYSPDDVIVMYAFAIAGVLISAGGLACFLIYFLLDEIKITHRKKGIPPKQENQTGYLKRIRVAFIVLLVVYYIFQSVILRTYSNYIVPFTVNHLGWSKAQGTNLSAAYFAAGIVIKLLMIFTVRMISLEIQVFGGLIFSNIAAVSLVLFVDSSDTIMWVFSIISSIGSCITVSVMIAWTDKYIGIKGYVGVLYSVAGSVGEVFFSALMGYLFENVSYLWLMYLLALCSGVCLLTMTVLQILGRKYQRESDTHVLNV